MTLKPVVSKDPITPRDLFDADFWRYILKSAWVFFPPLIFLFAAFQMFWKLSQGKDVMVISLEHQHQNSFAYTILALVFWSYVTWYSTRLVSKAKFLVQPDYCKYWNYFFMHGPRIMAYLCFSIVLLAYFQLTNSQVKFSSKTCGWLLLASFIAYFIIYWLWDKFTDAKKHESLQVQLKYLNSIRITTYIIIILSTLAVIAFQWFWGLIILLLGLKVGLVLLLIVRRKRIEILGASFTQVGGDEKKIEPHQSFQSKLRGLIWDDEDKMYFLVFLVLCLFVAVVYLCTVFIVPFSVRVGAFPFVLLAFGILLLLGNTVAVISILNRFNFHLLFIILAICIGLIFEPHYTSLPDKQQPSARFDQRQNLREFFHNWVNQGDRKQQIQQSTRPYPVYLVMANGGASRSGYWAASVLAMLEDSTHGEFSKHLFCLSGASGGSVGNAAFFSALRAKENLLRLDHSDTANLHAVKSYLQSDFLTFTLARMLGPDVFRHIFPLGFVDDRAAALARALEQAPGKSCFLYDSLAAGFSTFMTQKNQPDYHLPIICVNTTRMQDGNPAVVSNIDVSDTLFNRRVDVLDLIPETKDMKLSTAVVLGASFPYLSPAGRIDKIISKSGKPSADSLVPNYFVDGGYFDNSGAGVVNEMVIALQQMLDNPDDSVMRQLKGKLEFFVLHITNDPMGEPLLEKVNPLVNDLAAPVKTLVGAYGTQTTINDLRLRSYMNSLYKGGGHYQQINLYRSRDSVMFSMNWVISNYVREIMDKRLHENQPVLSLQRLVWQQTLR